MPSIVFIGDDFTGASDTLATLAERGATVRLFLDAPDEAAAHGLDAAGIATDLRARAPDDIAARLERLAPAVRRLSPRFVHYKVCSTFDSAPHVGSIGAAVKALEEALSPFRTIVVGGQPSLGRYCVSGTLFARAPDGEIHRIDRHPIMSQHPVTPMDEADLRLHLARQGLDGLALASRLGGARNREAAQPARRVLHDALDQADIERLGEALRRDHDGDAPILLVGASSVAEALVPEGRAASPRQRAFGCASGPVLAVAGSRSSATGAQIAAAARYARIPVAPADLDGAAGLSARCAGLLAAGRHVLIHLEPGADYRRAPAALSAWLAELTRAVVSRHRPAAIAVAGGDTSSAVVEGLGFESLSFVERAGAGVAVCRGHGAGTLDGTRLLLKGGQVGDVDLFERFAQQVVGCDRSPAPGADPGAFSAGDRGPR